MSSLIGLVNRIHAIDEALEEGYKIRPEVLNLVGRMGGSLWTTTRDRFELPRPDSKDPNEVQSESTPK